MRTTITLDDELLARARDVTGSRSAACSSTTACAR